MAVYNSIHTIILSIILLLVVENPANGELTESNSQEIKLSEELIRNNSMDSTVADENVHTRVKRQFGFGYPNPYYGGFYRRPIPIIVGGIGFGGFGTRGFGGRGFGGFGPRGFGGRGFGGRGFGGFGGRGFGGFGGRGFGGFGGRGIGGFGGRGVGGFGGRGVGGFGGRGGRG